MADEWQLVYEKEIPINFFCADGTSILKGTLLKLTDPMTVAPSNAANDIIGGVAAQDKIANDGRTKIAVYREGIFKAKIASGNTIVVGDPLVTASASNQVALAAVGAEKILGIALESGLAGETILVELRPTTMQLA
jgi:hypothetical protein